MRRLSVLPLMAVAAITFSVAACDEVQEGISAGPATAFPTAEGQNVGAVFVTLTNNNSTADALVGVSSTASASAELHSMESDAQGVMKMRRAESFTIEAKNIFALNSAGPHIMLMGLTKPLKAGETFNVTLDFQTAPDLIIPVKVQSPVQKQTLDYGVDGTPSNPLPPPAEEHGPH